MRGFTDKALILLSSPKQYAEGSDTYHYDYKLAVHNIIHYLQSMGIKHDCLITDYLATQMDMQNPNWLATGAPEDMFFLRTYCGVPDYPIKNLPPELMTTIRKKYPVERGLLPKDRYYIVAKRVKYAEQALMQRYSFIVVFGNEFHVKTKPEDGKAILTVHEKKFYTSLTLSGETIPINDFLQIPYANLYLSDWGKYRES